VKRLHILTALNPISSDAWSAYRHSGAKPVCGLLSTRDHRKRFASIVATFENRLTCRDWLQWPRSSGDWAEAERRLCTLESPHLDCDVARSIGAYLRVLVQRFVNPFPA
jgi:hypothetical protein